MTISESLAFVGDLRPLVEDLAESITIVLCPPYTALFAVSQALSRSPIELGAQNLYADSGKAHTGEVSAELLADVGCKWVMVGHWETRRRGGETDRQINAKIHAAFRSGLRPILLIGEKTSERGRLDEALTPRLADLFAGCNDEQAARLAVIYEPEWAIGVDEPAPAETVAKGCGFIRRWISGAFGAAVSKSIRIIYGGSVTPQNTERLLASTDIDGLGAGRKGRDAAAFAQIIRLIAAAKGLT